jgi:hypothetical protein
MAVAPFFGAPLLEVGFALGAEAYLPDPDDRHMVAAALACVADVIVTLNTSDFPASVLGPFGIAMATPDSFVVQLADSGIVASAAADHRTSLKEPPWQSTHTLIAFAAME